MKIAIYGATGMVGSNITKEAVDRGHQVTAISRTGTSLNGAFGASADLADLDTFLDVASKHDVVVITSGPSRTGASHSLTIDAHQAIIDAAPDVRIVVVGGAGSLFIGEGVRLKDADGFPEMYKAEAETMTTVLEAYEASVGVDWTVVSPAPMIGPGERTGVFTIGTDSPAGESISSEDFAVVILDEIEAPAFQGKRFTAAN